MSPHTEYGDARALDHEILRSVVGSGVLGIAIEGTDDHDEMGVYIETPGAVLGVHRERGDYIWRTQPEGVRSGHGDIDLVLYSLRKYISLVTKGNPTALTPLFAPEESLVVTTDLGNQLRENREWFLSNEAIERFLGYMHSQHERMLGGGKRNRVPNRPELIEKYGWDVKYGSHALRLAHQGRELALKGTLTLPLKEELRGRVLEVKTGKIPRDDVSAEITSIEKEINDLLNRGKTVLPDLPNVQKIEEWSVATHLSYWHNTHQTAPSR